MQCRRPSCKEEVQYGRAKDPNKVFCSKFCYQEFVKEAEKKRPIFSLEEIENLPKRKDGGYINRRASLHRWVGEHRLVMEAILQQKLTKGTSVHHKNGIRNDNSPKNLELWATHHPAGQKLCCPNCHWPLGPENGSSKVS